MSADALTHLVQRALRPEPAVAPRLPSPYETGRWAETEIERQEETEVRRPPVAGFVDDGGESPPKSRRGLPTENGSPSPRSSRRRGEGAPTGDLPGSTARLVAEREPQPAQTPTPPVLKGQPPPVGIPHGVITTRPGPDRAPGPAPPRRVEPVSSREPSRLAEVRSGPVARAPALAPATAVMPEEPGRPEPEPVVSITIGRVEVRTAPSSASPRPPRQPPERRVMSLEEYLDRRARGAP
jgi:hypothetical protein